MNGRHLLRTIAFATAAICVIGTQARAAGLSLGSITSFNFGSTYVGQQNTARVVVATNLGAAAIPVSISILNLGLGLPGAQFVQTNNCGTSLAAGASCSMWVNYTPTRVGNAQALLLFGGSNPTVYLVGTASPPDTSGIFIHVDQPAGNGAVAGKMTASGWALANHDSIARVWYSIDDSANIFFTAGYGSFRPDACQARPGVAGCPNVGWAFDVDTTVLSNGSHTLYVKATTQSSAVIKVVSAPFTVENRVAGPASLLQVDWPAPGATLAGSVNLFGWAIGSFGLPIFDVRILVDGAEQADVTTSLSRGDVCAVYPARPSCPNVGWSYLLDTTWLADGPHTLTFLTPGLSSNLAATVPITVANFTTSQSNPIRLVIDSPSAKTGNLGGTASLYGWALADNDFVDLVSVFVDGAYFGEALEGISRMDVCVAYPRRPRCPNVGWSYALDTTRLADGTHQFGVTARSNGKYETVQSQFTVSNASGSNPFHAYVDYPAAGGTVSGTPTFSGWALNDNARVDSVTISVDGVPGGSTFYALSRPDVCAAYPGRVNCPNVGWKFLANTLQFADGTHTLDITVNSGLKHATFGSSFTTANYPAANSTLLYIDQPNDASGTLSGTAAISGWAIDDRSPLYEAVSIAVDGITLGGPVSYGLPRQDVCDVYPGGLACPNVGWSFLLDTASLTDGPHTVTVTVSGAKRKSASVKINVANGNTAAPSYRVYIDQPGANGPALRGNTRVSGWAIVTSGFQPSITVYVDDIQAVANAVIEARPDVCAVFPAAQNCPYVGWSGNVDTTPFADGAHTLKVIANTRVFGAGFAVTPITIDNSTAVDPMHLSIDGSTSQLSGVANLWGWAVSDDASISAVSVAIDGAVLGNASYGDGRNDVCDIYQNRLGCPNLGWHLAVDTTKLSNGGHSVSVTATSSLDEQATQTATVAVNN
jgi:hypothetical protein